MVLSPVVVTLVVFIAGLGALAGAHLIEVAFTRGKAREPY